MREFPSIAQLQQSLKQKNEWLQYRKKFCSDVKIRHKDLPSTSY